LQGRRKRGKKKERKKEGRKKEGRKVGRKGGREEGRQEKRKERRKEGRKEGDVFKCNPAPKLALYFSIPTLALHILCIFLFSLLVLAHLSAVLT
jgi:hypothetical protein